MTATTTIGPVGILWRGDILAAAFRFGLKLDECRGLLTTTFRASGSSETVDAFRRKVTEMFRLQAMADHHAYVAEMERAEKRRHRWGRLILRPARFDPLGVDEVQAIQALMHEARRVAEVVNEAAAERLRRSRDYDPGRLSAPCGAATIATMVAVSMRYIQHDVRRGDIRLPKELRRRVLAARVPMETWDD